MTAAAVVTASALGVLGASPAPRATASNAPAHASAARRTIPVPRTPTTPQHSEFVIVVNAKGQVVRVKSIKPAQNETFNTMTYGNVLQTFIRRPDGSAVPGLYRMTYDYNPANKDVRRQVALLQAGNVDPNALGAVDQEIKKLAAEQMRARFDVKPTPSPLPDLKAITGHRH
jgi:hypothetical protein